MSKLIGEKYSRLRVISVSDKKGNAGQAYLYCQCECGKEKEIRVDNLTSGHTKSCGCELRKKPNRPRSYFVISSRAKETDSITEKQKIKNKNRRTVEDILANRALERELYSF